jgi:hypothetical protein
VSSAAVSPPVVKAKALFCPHCGGPVQLRGFAHTLSVVCPQCGSVLDTSGPLVQILQQAQAQQNIQPTVPLGTRGKVDGVDFEVIGFQVRTITVDDVPYSWGEYLLFNPYRGFAYLSEYQGHWNFIRTLPLIPDLTRRGGKHAVVVNGQTYLHFQHAVATTSYVLGEFPWKAHVGETAQVDDFVSPPFVVSAETTEQEVVWSRGDYRTGTDIWKAFGLPGNPPPAIGVYENQPSPYGGRVASLWGTYLWLLVALAVLMFFFTVTAGYTPAFHDHYIFSPGAKVEPSFVTPVFDLKGHTSGVRVEIKTDLNNSWAYFNLALINDTNGHAYDFGREVSYYHGFEDGESWSEGSSKTSATVPSVPAGRYYLRIEPELNDKQLADMSYEVEVRRGVPSYGLFALAGLLMLIPPIIGTVKRASFEAARWRESDYAPSSSSGGSD